MASPTAAADALLLAHPGDADVGFRGRRDWPSHEDLPVRPHRRGARGLPVRAHASTANALEIFENPLK